MAEEKPNQAADASEPTSEEPASGGENQSPSASNAPESGSPESSDDTQQAASSDLDEEQKIKDELGIGAEPDQAVSAEEIEQLLGDAVDGIEAVSASSALAAAAEGTPPVMRSTTNDAEIVDQNLQLLRDVNMKVKVELGRGRMYLKDILKLGQGSVVELERLAGDPLDIYVNEKVIARGEVLVLNENFCIRVTEIYDHALV